MTLEHYFILFIIYSFLGWIAEVINSFIIDRRFVNRGFLIGPYCPIYGVGAFIITIFLTRYKYDLLVFIVMTMFVCCVLEYFTSYLMEKIFKTRWWNYSNRKFNINGRVCLETAICFGALGILLVYVFNPIFINLLLKIPTVVINIIFYILLLIFLLDFAVSFKIITNIKNIKLNPLKDSTEEITKIVKNTLLNNSILNRRIVKAFPNFKITENVKKIKEKLEKMNKNSNKSPQ